MVPAVCFLLARHACSGVTKVIIGGEYSYISVLLRSIFISETFSYYVGRI